MAHALSDMPAEEMRAGKWSDFSTRFASALILAPVVLLALWYGGWAWVMVTGMALAGLGWEWARLAGVAAARFALPGALLLALAVMLQFGWLAALMVLAAAAAVLTWWFGWFLAAGAPYAGLGGLSLLWLRLQPGRGLHDGLHDTLFLVAVIWATDIGAYVLGRLAGGRKLAPKISPGKTWSGAAGGLLLAGVAGVILAGAGMALPAAVLLSCCGQGGDLLESAIKRRLGVKDSGRTIPGHGGLFDRLDGFLTASPLAAVMVLAGALPWR